jgi:surface antigen
VNRNIGMALRRTAGGGAAFMLGVGALVPRPEPAAPTPVAAAPLPVRIAQADPEPQLGHDERTARLLRVVALEQPAAAALVRPSPAAVTQRRPLVHLLRIAAAPAAAPARRASSVANGFTYGYCTWWVASKRSVPWRGNAAQWWWNARAMGFAEGAVPRPGAIMVMGISASSPYGHVAYVESVNGNGSFTISEMNWWGVPGGGWGRVDVRTVTSMSGILGFIY